ncbi:MAG: hypothetical protein KDB00_17570 [Planctomycetales bacterium]|nr:hypothetical protein [Planctomycetales bacterium]
MLLIDGDGSESVFTLVGPDRYAGPPADDSEITRAGEIFTRTLKDGTVQRFNAFNRLEAIEFVDGTSIGYRYNAGGKVTAMIDPAGGSFVFSYSGNTIASISDPAGRTTRFRHNSDGDLISVTRPDGAVRAYTYDNHLLDRVTDENGNTSSHEYDFAGRVKSATKADGARLDFKPAQLNGLFPLEETKDPLSSRIPTASELGQPELEMIDSRGNLSTTVMDGNGRPLAYTDSIGLVNESSFNDDGLALKSTSSVNEIGFGYDGARNVNSVSDKIGLVYSTEYSGGRVTSRTDGAGVVTTYDINSRGLTNSMKIAGVTQATYTHNTFGLVETMTDGNGNQYRYDYDDMGRLTKETRPDGVALIYTYDEYGNVASRSDGNGQVYHMAYDIRGHLLSLTDPLGNVERYEYDPYGNVIRMVDANGGVTNYEYDSRHRQVSATDPLGGTVRYTYDRDGNLATQTDRNGNTTTFSYDARGRQISMVDPLGNRWSYRYDSDDNLIAEIDPNGGRSTYSYDKRGRLISDTSPTGDTYYYAYDAADRRISETDARGSKTGYGYDALGRLSLIVDAMGGTTQMEYDAVGNLISETDELGRKTLYSYDALNRQISMTDANGSVYEFEYDGEGRLIRTIDPLGREDLTTRDSIGRPISKTDTSGNTTTYEYDAKSNVMEVTDPLGNQTRYEYDSLDRRVSITDTLDHTATFAYDPEGNLLLQTDRTDAVSEFVYDAANRPVELIDAEGNIYRYEYDAIGNRVRTINPRGAVTTEKYDAASRLIATTDAVGSTWTIQFDSVGNVIREVDPLGRTTTRTYDRLNRQTSIKYADGAIERFTFDAASNLTSKVDPLGNRWTYSYDNLDRLVTSTNPLGDTTVTVFDAVGNRIAETDELGNTRSYTYDAMNRMLKSIDALGRETSYQYDANGNTTRMTDIGGGVYQYEYDNRNRVVKVIDTTGRVSQFEYDAEDRKTKYIDGLGNETQYVYDKLGRETQSIDALGGTSTTSYDSVGYISSFVDPAGRTTQYEVNLVGLIIETTDSSGATAKQEFDASRQLVRSIDPLGNIESYQYDPVGRLTTMSTNGVLISQERYDLLGETVSYVDGSGNETEYQYDSLHRKISQTDASGDAYFWEYDAAGNKTRVVDPRGVEATFTYDNVYRVTSETYSDEGSIVEQLNYQFDSLDRVSQIANADFTLDFVYDNEGRLISESSNGSGVDWKAEHSYDQAGRLVHTAYSVGSEVVVEKDIIVDALARPTSIDMTGQWITDHTVGMTFDPTGRITSITRSSDAETGPSTNRTYDDAGRLTAIVHSNDGTPLVQYAYSYDQNSRVRQVVEGNTTLEFEYDGFDQIRSVKTNGVTTSAYFFDSLGNPTDADVVVGQENELRETANYTFEFDSSGNLIRQVSKADGSETIYQWDHKGRMVELSTYDTNGVALKSAKYTYDPLDRRAIIELDADGDGPEPSTVEADLYDGSTIIGKLTVEETSYQLQQWRTTAPSSEMVLAISSVDSLNWFLTDYRGSTRLVTDSAGLIESEIDYDMFGNITAATGPVPDILFAGQEYDSESGLYYMSARLYDPTTGRFISRDPAGFSAGDANLYRYVGNDPANNFDPTGLAARGLDSHSFSRAVGNAVVSQRSNDAAASAINLRLEDSSERSLYQEFRQQREIAKQTHPADMAGLFLEEFRVKARQQFLSKQRDVDTSTLLGKVDAFLTYSNDAVQLSINDLVLGKIAMSGSVGAPSLVAHSAEIVTLQPIWQWLADPLNPDKMEAGLGLFGTVLSLGVAGRITYKQTKANYMKLASVDHVNCVKTYSTKTTYVINTPKRHVTTNRPRLPGSIFDGRRPSSPKTYEIPVAKPTPKKAPPKPDYNPTMRFKDEAKYPLINQNDLGITDAALISERGRLKTGVAEPKHFEGQVACHPSAVKMLCDTHGIDISIEELITLFDTYDIDNKHGLDHRGFPVKAPATSDVNKLKVIELFEQHGFNVEFYDHAKTQTWGEGSRTLSYDDLRSAVRGGAADDVEPTSYNSVLVLEGAVSDRIRSSGRYWDHSVVVDGIRPELNPVTGKIEDRIYLRDPEGHRDYSRVQRREMWASEWVYDRGYINGSQEFLGWAVVVTPKLLTYPGFISTPIDVTIAGTELINQASAMLEVANDQWTARFGDAPAAAIEIQITDLPDGQLASAKVRSTDNVGNTTSAVIEIDSDGDGAGWFVDATPLFNEEFSVNAMGLLQGDAQVGSHYDLWTVINHELSHLLGFALQYDSFAANVSLDDHSRLVFDSMTGNRYFLDSTGNELDAATYQSQLMAGSLSPSTRKQMTEIDADIIRTVQDTRQRQATYSEQPITSSNVVAYLHAQDHLSAHSGFTLFSDSIVKAIENGPPVGLRNQKLLVTDPNASNFAWSTVSNVAIPGGSATITEDVGMISDLSQTFVVPAGINTLSFTLTGLSLDVGGVADANAVHPPEVFEVAMLDSISGASMLSEMTGLGGGDALLSIQADGTVYFADGVTVSGARRSGRVVDLTQPIDVVINLPAEVSGDTATLMFDLVGFGDDASQVQVGNILLEASNGWQNPINQFDVDNNDSVTPFDALVILNELARATVHHRSTNKLFEITDEVGPPPFYDVNGNGFITPLDALRVINEVARQQAAEPEMFDEALAELLDEI